MTPLDLALRYYECGFSTFPLRPRTKQPAVKWSRYQTDRASRATISQWWSEWPDAGVAVVAGAVSGGLVVLDVDHHEFSDFVKERAERLNTWVVQTGSGKVHIYFRSDERCVTTELKTGDRFLADIRGDGQGMSGPSYLAAPPTIHPDTGEPYLTLYGSPETIRSVPNACDVFLKIGEKFAGSARLTAPEASNSLPAVLPTMTGISEAEITAKLTAEIGITGKVRRAILRDAKPGDGEWPNAATHSEIDFAVSCALVEAGWSAEEVQATFHYFPVGAVHYRDPGRPGQDYLSRTLGRAQERVQKKQEAARVAEGENFRVKTVTKVSWTDPKYELLVEENDHEHVVVIEHDDLFSELSFRKRLGRVTSELPRLKLEHSGSRKKFEQFSNILLHMAAVEYIPEEATDAGHFRAAVAQEMRALLMVVGSRGRPESKEEFEQMWADKENMYVRGTRFVNHMNKLVSASPHAVWEAVRSMGGTEQILDYDGAREKMWVVSRKVVE